MTKYGSMASSSDGEKQTPIPASDFAPIQSITCHKLNGQNYLQWSQSVMMFICGKGKEDFISGCSKRPDPSDGKFKVWNAENNMLMSWLINSMTPDIGENFLLYQSAKELWDAVKDTYSTRDNTSELFGVESSLHDVRQGEDTVTTYFNALTKLWQQLDLFESHDWKCADDESHFRKIVETKCVFKFLLGLNPSLDEVRERILSTKPLPGLRAAFSEVRHQESCLKLMLGPSRSTMIDASAFASARSLISSTPDCGMYPSPHTAPANNQPLRHGRLWCGKYKKLNHTVDTCWHIHSKPMDWKSSRERRANSAATNNETPVQQQPFTKEQLDALQRLFIQNSAQSPSLLNSGNAAHQGEFPTTLLTKHEFDYTWIVDSGASDHMTGCMFLFSSYEPCRDHRSVQIANGSSSKILGVGSVWLSHDICLQSVLFVPGLAVNLLSVSKINVDLHCSTLFSADSCLFQDLASGKTIDSADLHAGLFLLRMEPQFKNQHCCRTARSP